MTPDKYTRQDFMLPVGDGYKIHVIDWGNREAETPFIFLHGGPGGCVKDKSKMTFDPTRHRVIFFDQRGCGESKPYGSLKNNTTRELVEDITKIADHLKLDKFNLYGCSWGSTLALYYAIQHPDRVQNLVICGVYSGTNDLPRMLDYCKIFFPEAHDEFIENIPEDYRKDPIKYYLDRLEKGTPSEQKRAAYELSRIEATIMSYNYDFTQPSTYEEFELEPARIELHYIANDCFMPRNYLLKHAHKIAAKTYIVQGRADLVCPPEFAYRISQEIPDVRIYWTFSNHRSEREVKSILRTICSFL